MAPKGSRAAGSVPEVTPPPAGATPASAPTPAPPTINMMPYRENAAYEPLRNNDGSVPLRRSNGTPTLAQDAGQPPLDRASLGTPAPGLGIQRPPNQYAHSFDSGSDQQRSAEQPPLPPLDRRSVESKPTPMNLKRSSVPPPRPGSVMTRRFSEEAAEADTLRNYDSAGLREHSSNPYFEPSGSPAPPAGPAPGQFLQNRGRPLSFYDMKEQQQQNRQRAGSSLGVRPQLMNNRISWRSGDMPYNYADMIGGNRYNYAPPRMGSRDELSGIGSGSNGGRGRGRGPTRTYANDNTGGEIALRLPWTMWMNSNAKNLFVAAVGEWVGTTMFLFFAFAGTQVANAQSKTPAQATTTNATAGFDPQVMMYISISFGFSLMVNVWIFFRISGGLFNPAVTLALWATGGVSVGRSIALFIAQLVGSITASALVLAIFPTPLNVRTTLSDGTSIVQGLFIEALATAELVFTILMLAKEKHRATFIAPVGIGLALFVAELVGVYYTGGSLNPARSFGPCAVTGAWDREHWIYWVGPFMGCIFALAFYKFIKILEYEMANPGQDGDEANDPTKNPDHEIREKQRDVTARVLASLGIDQSQQLPQHQQQVHQASLERLEEGNGSYYGGRGGMPNGSIADDDERHAAMAYGHNNALSTVASISEAASPTHPYHLHHAAQHGHHMH
ncbi:aquaporin-like protein [Xylariomycetidae sp. FL0641]|nr:aquaporin-like protein [Xylariomycetidae sp. FL0641]